MLLADIKRYYQLNKWTGLNKLNLLITPGFWAGAVYRFGNFFTKIQLSCFHNIGIDNNCNYGKCNCYVNDWIYFWLYKFCKAVLAFTL